MIFRPSGPETDLPQRFLTLSNLLSIIRMLSVIPFVLVMLPPSAAGRLWGALIMLAAAATDWLDGFLARRFHQTSDWGKILDPLADKVAVLSALVVLVTTGDLPLWYAALGIARDLLIACGGVIIRHRQGLLLASNEFGKWTVGVISLTLFGALIGVKGIVLDSLVGCSSVMMVISLFLYANRARAALSGRAHGPV